MRQPEFVTNEIYHVYNRGVEKRKVFMGDKDYLRFIHDLFEFNDIAAAQKFIPPSRPLRSSEQYSEVELPNIEKRKPRSLFVEILTFCLMPNHFHLMLREKKEGGITEFMRKLGTGYTNYFNEKYKRVGPLFQGTFKSVHIEKQHHLLYLPHYIHLNPLDLFMPEWRDQRVKSASKSLAFLESYRWSSYLDYIGKKNFPSVTQRDFLHKIFGSGTSESYKEEMVEWLKELELSMLEGVTFCGDT